MTASPSPPDHLSESAAEWWSAVLDSHFLEPHHLKLLQAACEAWDRAQSAREAVAEHGVVTKGRYGQLVGNPAAIIEKESRSLFARLLSQLDLDSEPRTSE
jgi:P27 family predicted phage terminase small subunit